MTGRMMRRMRTIKNSRKRINERQQTLDAYNHTIIYRKVFKEFEILISQYERTYNTDKFDKYDLYDFTWKAKTGKIIKNMQRNVFFNSYTKYLQAKGFINKEF